MRSIRAIVRPMETPFRVRRSTAILLLAIVLLGALTCSVASVGIVALIALPFFIAAIVSLFVAFTEEPELQAQLFALPVFSPRPPPVR